MVAFKGGYDFLRLVRYFSQIGYNGVINSPPSHDTFDFNCDDESGSLLEEALDNLSKEQLSLVTSQIKEIIRINIKALEDTLFSIGRDFRVSGEESFARFSRQTSLLMPRYLMFRLPFVIKTNDDEVDNCDKLKIRIDATFPSTKTFPVLDYLIGQKRPCYIRNSKSPYSLVVRAIRRGYIDKQEREFAEDILGKMDDKGFLDGRRILNPADVDIARNVLYAAYHT